MAQFRIYGHRPFLETNSARVSDALHGASISALGIPEEKRFHRFLLLEDWQFIAPGDRGERYLIIEINMFEGRPVGTKKAFYREILLRLGEIGVSAQDIEVTIVETPRHNWLIRGLPGDELSLNYRIEHEAESPE